ncbi:portal protein [Gordonia phage Sour]|uniref:Portal protein n=1 Tax=Gordonia phage Sour TaxID=2182349 RepID=A0A2U8UKI5_9CAUD|nr:portal protein [Gordonia phage Sour]AWN04212.1 portal protein [Gordonia phage Sour]
MTAPSYRIVRRPRGAVERTSLTAASQPIDDPSKSFKSSMGGSRDNWQDDAWEMLDSVGELRYYVGWRASSCSRVRLIASDIDPETGLPTGGTDNARVQEIARAIAGGPLGQAQLLRRMVECLTVPGETWVVIIHPPEGEEWLALSRDEIKTRQNDTIIERPSGEEYILRKPADSMFRVWNPRPRRAKQADSPVRATLDPLREIVRTTKTISNASKSRLIGNGVVFVPQEMSLPSQNQITPSRGPGAPDAPEIAPEFAGASAVGQLQELLYQVASTAYDDEDSLAALIPMFAAVPGEAVKNVSHLKFDNSVTEIAIKTRNDAIARLAMGLDVTPERLLGLGSNSNHWSAWQIGDDDVRLHISPPIETICQALYSQAMSKLLIAEGIDPTQYILWYDASVLTADPDLTDEATSAFDRGAITAEAYREFLGLGDTGYDFSTLTGWQDWARDRVSAKPELISTLLPLLGDNVEIAAPAPAPAVEQGDEEPDDEPVDAESEPDTEGDEPDDGPANTAETAVIEVMVARALELAGKRRRSRADHNRLRSVPLHETHRYMDPVRSPEVPALIKGWDASLEEDALRRLGISPERVRFHVRRHLTKELTRTVVDA